MSLQKNKDSNHIFKNPQNSSLWIASESSPLHFKKYTKDTPCAWALNFWQFLCYACLKCSALPGPANVEIVFQVLNSELVAEMRAREGPQAIPESVLFF